LLFQHSAEGIPQTDRIFYAKLPQFSWLAAPFTAVHGNSAAFSDPILSIFTYWRKRARLYTIMIRLQHSSFLAKSTKWQRSDAHSKIPARHLPL
jgi:hypothetical protein